MLNKEPQKINPNDSGIDFSKSEKIRKYFKNDKTHLYKETIPGPVIGEELIIYVDNSRVKKIVQLDEQNLIINIEKNTKISLKNVDIQISNLKQ